jgi:copper chaperone CopZ
VISNFEVDANCPYCFDDILAALRDEPDVSEVRASMATGCVSVTHDTDEVHLADVIENTGHRIVVAGNAEIVQGGLHAVSRRTCRVHR